MRNGLRKFRQKSDKRLIFINEPHEDNSKIKGRLSIIGVIDLFSRSCPPNVTQFFFLNAKKIDNLTEKDQFWNRNDHTKFFSALFTKIALNFAELLM